MSTIPLHHQEPERFCCDGLCVQGRDCPLRRTGIERPLVTRKDSLVVWRWVAYCLAGWFAFVMVALWQGWQ